MENNSQNKDKDRQHENHDYNTNGAHGESAKLSDYPEGNTDEAKLQTDSIAGNQTDQPAVEKSVGEATDPAKLSDL